MASVPSPTRQRQPDDLVLVFKCPQIQNYKFWKNLKPLNSQTQAGLRVRGLSVNTWSW